MQRNAANARERARMRVLSSAFGRLKTKLPNIPPDTKLSKLDTLRLATMYIKQLKAVVEGGDNANLNGDHINGAINRNANGFLSSHHTTQSMVCICMYVHLRISNKNAKVMLSDVEDTT